MGLYITTERAVWVTIPKVRRSLHAITVTCNFTEILHRLYLSWCRRVRFFNIWPM